MTVFIPCLSNYHANQYSIRVRPCIHSPINNTDLIGIIKHRFNLTARGALEVLLKKYHGIPDATRALDIEFKLEDAENLCCMLNEKITID